MEDGQLQPLGADELAASEKKDQPLYLPVDPASPYSVKRLAEFLKGGGRLVLFAEDRCRARAT